MADLARRRFLQHTTLGLATAGMSSLLLRADAQPTPAVDAEELSRVLVQMGPAPPSPAAPAELPKVTPMSYGPWYKPGAPFRGKLSVPGEAGTTFVLSGRVWAFDTRRPLAGVVLDFWHVDLDERYSDGESDFRNRGRLMTSETGSYEVESIRPIPYRPNPGGSYWRCAHFHVLAQRPGYAPLVTEIHFRDDPHADDPMYRSENAIAVRRHTARGQSFESGVFDLVLTPAG